MTHLSRSFKLSATALAASLMLVACGGGTTEPPTDTVPPTVSITDSEAAAVASGDVTFTFTFNESVGSTFVADDVTVAGGSKGAFTMASNGLSATLVVSPTASAAGTLVVTVASGAFSDLAGNASTVAFTASQDYDTTAAPPTGGTLVTNFDDVLPVGDLGQFGDAGASIAEAPAGGTGAALKLDRSGGVNFGGTFYTVTPAIPFEANRKTMTARVYATRANAVVYLKVEAPGGVATEVAATVTEANTWQTLTWNLNGVNPGSSYTTVVISADTDVAIGGPQTYWVDDITLAPSSGEGGSPTVLTFSSGFASFDRTIEGGFHGGFSGSDQDNFSCDYGNPENCGAGGGFTSSTPAVAAAETYFFNYFQTSTPPLGLYSGIFVFAPGVVAANNSGDTPGLTITNQTQLNITVGQNPEWFSSATNNFVISMDFGKWYVLGSGAGCRLQVRAVVTPTAVEARYSVPLSAFTLVQNCGGVASTAAQAFAQSPVSQINVQANGGTIALEAGGKTSGGNTTVPNGDGKYATTVLIKGDITFD